MLHSHQRNDCSPEEIEAVGFECLVVDQRPIIARKPLILNLVLENNIQAIAIREQWKMNTTICLDALLSQAHSTQWTNLAQINSEGKSEQFN